MNYGCQLNSCGCNNTTPTFSYNPYGCQAFPINGFGYQGSFGFGGNASTWLAIVLVIFIILIVCGCTKIC